MDKINRTYSIRAQGQDQKFVEVERPFTIEFDIQQNTLAENKFGNFTIYNLGSAKRNILRLDHNSGEYRTCTFDAGYGTNLANLFKGTVMRAWSDRPSTEWKTHLTCSNLVVGRDSELQAENARFPAGTPIQEIIEAMIACLAKNGILRGAVGEFPGVIARANSYCGNVLQILKDLTEDQFFISRGRAYALNDNECVQGPIAVITSDSGLLGTPVREWTNVHLNVMFEPQIRMGQILQVKSLTGDSGVNQLWKVNGISHRGTISETVCGDAVTTLSLYQPDLLLKVVKG